MTTSGIHRVLRSSLADPQPVHFRTVPCDAGLPVENSSAAWNRVTCGGCLLEQPLSAVPAPGVVEYRIPENVAQRDAELAARDMLWMELGNRLAVEEAAQVRMGEMITELHELREKSAVRVQELKDQLKTIS